MGIILSLFLISYSPYFLTLYPGGQQTAMGGANVSIAEDAFGIFYNPGGIALQNNIDITFENSSIPEFEYGPFSFFVKTKHWGFGINIPLFPKVNFGFFGTGIYTSFRDSLLGYHNWVPSYIYIDEILKDFATGFSFAYKVSDYIGTGVGVKYIYCSFSEQYQEYNTVNIDRSVGVDFGGLARYNFLLGNTSFGLAVQNLGPKMNKDNLPLNIRAGLSYKLSAKDLFNNVRDNWLYNWFYEKWRVVLAYDINWIFSDYIFQTQSSYNERKEKPWHSFGVELRPVPFFAIRFGHFDNFNTEQNNKYRKRDWTIGLGIDLKFLRIDISDNSAFYERNTNCWKVSLSLNIGAPVFPQNGLLNMP